MEINSLGYLLFVGISLLLYWLIPHRFQWILLLIDSFIFYFFSTEPRTIIYVLISALSAYVAAILFNSEKYSKYKKMILWFVILCNVGILAVLKYTNMIIGTINFSIKTNLEMVKFASSLAVSYYTLQIIAYIVDSYLRVIKPEKNFLKLLLFTMFFPQMVSGPISRWNNLGHQLFDEHRFDYDRVTTGMRRILWGIGKKMVVADRLGILVSYMFDNVDVYSGVWIIIAALCFVVELYFDFSGCMDIIIGVANCFGIKLSENFNSPFMSKTVQEFWQRWHMTLGGWLRDYIMYPISRSKNFKEWGRKCKKKYGKKGIQIPYYFAMFVVWTLMGVWHGNSWKFIIGEGWYFWILIVLSQILTPTFKKIKSICRIKDESKVWNVFQIVRTTILVALGNIAFRASSLSQTIYMFKRMFVYSSIRSPLQELPWGEFGGGIVLLGVGTIGLLQVFCDIYCYKGREVQELITKQKFLVRWILYLGYTAIIICAGAFGKSQFIYFGF